MYYFKGSIMSESILKCENLCFSYEDELSLNNISLDIKRGSVTAVLGRNGAGKSTLFLTLNGINIKDKGSVYFNDKLVEYNKKGISEIRRNIGIVFQDPNDQLFSASVIKDVSFGALNLGLSHDEARKRAEKALKEVEMYDYMERPTHALSFGQKKRVAIAGILVMEPELIILDEPTAGLDPMGANEILVLLKKINKEKGTTIIIATHEMDIVPLYCDYAYVLDKGSVVMQGSPEEIFCHADELRKYDLRLPRIAHLMEILKKYDNIAVDESIDTISKARRAIKELINGKSN